MHQSVIRRRSLDADGLHHAAARRGAVARMNIDVLAPQAYGTVVGKSAAADVRAALCACKIFHGTLKNHGCDCTVYCTTTLASCVRTGLALDVQMNTKRRTPVDEAVIDFDPSVDCASTYDPPASSKTVLQVPGAVATLDHDTVIDCPFPTRAGCAMIVPTAFGGVSAAGFCTVGCCGVVK